MKVKNIIDSMNSFADEAWAFDRDNSGLQVGDVGSDVSRILLAVDPTEEAIDEAISLGCHLLITHHPLLFEPIRKITDADKRSNIIKKLILNNISLYASHTCFDVSPKGINAYVSHKYQLHNKSFLGDWSENFHGLELYIPTDYAEQMMKFLFELGVGKIGMYSDCAYTLDGTGRFTPGEFAKPAIGINNIPEKTMETKIEAIFPRKSKNAVISAIMKYHPYETPVFKITEFENACVGIGIGIIGDLDAPMESEEFFTLTKNIFQSQVLRSSSNYQNKKISRVAFCSGSSTEYIPIARAMGADVMITSECKSHHFDYAVENDMILISLTHFLSERCFMDAMRDALCADRKIAEEIEFFESKQTDHEVFV